MLINSKLEKALLIETNMLYQVFLFLQNLLSFNPADAVSHYPLQMTSESQHIDRGGASMGH